MANLIIPAAIVRAAQQCVTAESGNVYRPRGILFAANGDVVATNGEVLFKAENAFTVPSGFESTVIQICRAIPAKAKRVHIDCGLQVDHVYVDSASMITYESKTLDETFPKYERVIPGKDYFDPDSTVYLSGDHLAKISKIYPHMNVSIHHGKNTDGPVVIKATGIADGWSGNNRVYNTFETMKDTLVLIAQTSAPKR